MLREFVASVILTGRIRGRHPVSCLLIASPESGKTSIIIERNVKNLWVLTDVTGRGLIDLCKHHPEISHFAILDMGTMMSHKQQVNSYTFGILLAMTEEGLRTIAIPGTVETFDSRGRRAIIGAITAEMSKDKRRWWSKQGFSSRMIPFNYKYSDPLILKIKGMIDGQVQSDVILEGKTEKEAALENLRIPDFPVNVHVSAKMSQKIQTYTDQLASRLTELGIRRKIQFRTLACGHALIKKVDWKKGTSVGDQEIEFIENVMPFISYDKSNDL